MSSASPSSSDIPPSLASENTSPITNVHDDVSASVSRKQRITIVGAGAVGSYYGARLWEAGHIVTFYMRGEHQRVVQQDGMTVTSVHGNIRIPAEKLLTVNDTSAVTEPVDWVILALKSSSLEAIPDLIYHMLTPNTKVLVIMNGLMIEEELIRMLKERAGEIGLDALQCCQTLYGGLGLLGCIRVAPGKIEHSHGGMLAAGVASSRSGNPEKDQAAFEQLLAGTTVEAVFEPCLLRGRWTKMVGNLPTNGISVAMGGITVDQIISDPDLRKLAELIMDEAISIANADLDAQIGPGCFVPLGEAEKNRVLFVCGVSKLMRYAVVDCSRVHSCA
jgi:2-dehydropantoate 2-reductase